MAEHEYLRFEETWPTNKKTAVVMIYSKRWGSLLGTIKWYGPWRQYVLEPQEGTVWNPDCLVAVNAVIRDLMDRRKHGDEDTSCLGRAYGGLYE